MGEIADMMLDGTLCEGCGKFIGSDVGYPQYCSEACARDRGADSAAVHTGSPSAIWQRNNPSERRQSFTRRGYRGKRKAPRDTPCTICGKLCRGQEGMELHRRMKHGEHRDDG